jgi:uncharacterized membrane protein
MLINNIMEHLYQPIVETMDIDEKYYDDIFQYIDKHSNYESLKNIETNFNLENTTLPLALTIIREFLGDKDIEITLNKGDKLRAEAACNLHGIYDNVIKI